MITNDVSFLLIALLGLIAGGIGVLFQKTVYRGEDAADGIWGGGRNGCGRLRAGSFSAVCCCCYRRCMASATR